MYWLIGLLWKRLGWTDLDAAPGAGNQGFGLAPFGTGPFGN